MSVYFGSKLHKVIGEDDIEECVRSRDELVVKVSKDDKIKLLEAKVSLLEAEVLFMASFLASVGLI